MQTIIVIGAGAHGRIVAEAAALSGLYQVLGLADDNPAKQGLLIDDISVLGPWAGCEADCYVVAIGNNPARKVTYEALRTAGRVVATVVSPHAIVSPKAHLGEGTVVLAGVVIQAGAKVGNNVVVNAGAVIDHDTVIGDHAQVGLCATVVCFGAVNELESLPAGVLRLRRGALEEHQNENSN